MTEKVYIAGLITGDPDYREKFKQKQDELEAQGYVVMNPASMRDGFEYTEYMKVCMAMIDTCDSIYLLKDWGQSKGAMIEYHFAKALDKGVLLEVNAKEMCPTCGRI